MREEKNGQRSWIIENHRKIELIMENSLPMRINSDTVQVINQH